MPIELTESTVGMWFVSDGEQDVMFHLAKEDDVATLTYRFRTYVDEEAFDSKDEKSWHGMTCDLKKTPLGEQKLIDTVEMMIEELQAKTPSELIVHKVFMGAGGLDDFMERFMKLPCMHAKTMSTEEYNLKYPEEKLH